ncbi:Hint domain-containing protein [Streptomyces sp. NPDC093801]|uniref:Hint domain-containing protein n=1 Tax=Streptomyces sp. NPDC093801 TaxID=3155203 RepID=UPI00344D9933
MDGITCENSVDNLGYMLGLGLYAELDQGGELEKSLSKIFFAGKSAARVGKSKPGVCKNSFVSGTRVLLADGTSKPIEELKPDDKVLATDPETGETTTETVTAAIRTEDDKEYVDLTIETVDGPQTITTTDHHPFWSESDREWRDAETLIPGTHLRTADGESVTLTSARTYRTHLVTHNLTVAALHTYYVLAGATPVLVHNAGECPVDGMPHGALGESATLNELQKGGYTDITREVRFKNSQGKVFRADFVAKNPAGEWTAIEVKTGKGATVTENQEIGYPELAKGGAILNTSRVPGLTKGSKVQMKVEVDLWECPTCKP